MKEKNGIEVADKSIRNVPLGLWCRFVGRCKTNNMTVTQGIIEAVTLWMNKEG
jgi:hypothetical protein